MSDSDRKRAQALVQELLLQAQLALAEAGSLAAENGLGDLSFLGLRFEAGFGWFSYDGELQEESDWNASSCVIGSRYAAGYGGEGWGDDWPFKDGPFRG